MKHLTLFAVASLLVGCAAEAEKPVAMTTPPPVGGRTSSALAFDPPIARGWDASDLSRDQRGQAALLGFEEPSTSTYDVFTYNRQASNFSSYYDKEAVSERVGTVHR